MCGIYGVLSYKDKLKDMNELVDLLSMESAERGTDATGVAYSILGNMKINKSAVSAYKFNPNIPKFVNAVIGHTRHSTQGDKSKNYNNHPWSERVKNCQFALAHNGVLFNDKELQKKYTLSMPWPPPHRESGRLHAYAGTAFCQRPADTPAPTGAAPYR